MIEKFGHVKNPLSVIAIFAGIAEVSGTLVLPHIDLLVQELYVWFLMIFPCILVILFFAILAFRPDSLYAPSDYADEKNFMQLRLRPASQSAIEEKKREFEVDFSVPEPERPSGRKEPDQQAEQEQKEQSQQQPKNHAPPTQTVQAGAGDQAVVAAPAIASAPGISSSDAFLLESLAINRLSRDRGMLLAREVEVLGIPNMVFDAAEVTSSSVSIVEVFSLRSSKQMAKTLDTLNRISDFFDRLAPDLRKKFRFLLVLIDTGKESAFNVRVAESGIRAQALKYKFPVEIIKYSAQELRGN